MRPSLQRAQLALTIGVRLNELRVAHLAAQEDASWRAQWETNPATLD